MKKYIVLACITILFAMLPIGVLRSNVGSLVEQVPVNLVGFGNESVFEDLRFPATTLRQGATAKPDFDPTDVGLLFPQNDSAEIAYAVAQFPHAWKIGTDACLHVHWIQVTSLQPTWKADVRWYDSDSEPGSFSTISANTKKFAYSLGEELSQISDFACIDGSSITGLSSILDIKFYRDDNQGTGDILVKEIDLHIELDSLGSRQEYIK